MLTPGIAMHPAVFAAIPVAGVAAVALAAFLYLLKEEERPLSQHQLVHVPGKGTRIPGANNGYASFMACLDTI